MSSRIVFIGTSRALPTAQRDNTSILFETNHEAVLIDCSGKTYQSLLKCNTRLNSLNTIIITHAHTDHCYGLPSLLCSLWLGGRREPLDVVGLSKTIDRIVPITRLYGWPDEWRSTPPIYDIRFNSISSETGTFAFNGDELSVQICQNNHAIPNIATKIHFKKLDLTVVYSSDTSEPYEPLMEFAKGADWLIHEASFMVGMEAAALRDGHSTPSQVGIVATTINVDKLYLVHHGIDNPIEIEQMKRDVNTPHISIIVPNDMDEVKLD